MTYIYSYEVWLQFATCSFNSKIRSSIRSVCHLIYSDSNVKFARKPDAYGESEYLLIHILPNVLNATKIDGFSSKQFTFCTCNNAYSLELMQKLIEISQNMKHASKWQQWILLHIWNLFVFHGNFNLKMRQPLYFCLLQRVYFHFQNCDIYVNVHVHVHVHPPGPMIIFHLKTYECVFIFHMNVCAFHILGSQACMHYFRITNSNWFHVCSNRFQVWFNKWVWTVNSLRWIN